jgi:hypothetical protein
MKSETGKIFPCACGCGQSVDLSKALHGLDYVFHHGGPRGSCRRRFNHWTAEHDVTEERVQFLFRWYRANVVVQWTADDGSLHRSAFRQRTIEHSRTIVHADFPADLPAFWRDFAYAPHLGDHGWGGNSAPEGHVFTHFAFLHLNESDHQSVEPDELVEVVSPAREHHLYG